LASFKIPKYFIFLKPDQVFPLTITGKVQKFIMREQSVKILKLDGIKDAFQTV
jgi:fatty-acyl-CoA synthase